MVVTLDERFKWCRAFRVDDGQGGEIFRRKSFLARRSNQSVTPHIHRLRQEGVSPVMDPKTYPEWQASLLKQLVATTKAASAVGSQDVSFERSIDSKFDSSLTSVTDRLLALSNRLLKFAGSKTEEFEDEDDLEDRWAEIVDVVDGLLERAVILSF